MAYSDTPIEAAVEAGQDDWHSSGAPIIKIEGPEGEIAIRFLSDKPTRHPSKFYRTDGKQKANWWFDVEQYEKGLWGVRILSMSSRQLRDAFTRLDKNGGLLGRVFGIKWAGLGVERKYSVFECEAPK